MFVLGLDVGKSELYACLLQVQIPGSPTPVGVVKAVANTAKGHEQLLLWLMKSAAVGKERSVVMESTSVYWERIAITMGHPQHPVGKAFQLDMQRRNALVTCRDHSAFERPRRRPCLTTF